VGDDLASSDQLTVRLGKSGLKVSRIILGCMSYGGGEEWTLSEKESIEQIKAAYALGINVSSFLRIPRLSIMCPRQTFDTANIYSYGQSEVILGKAIKEINAPRESFVIMTKLCFPTLENKEMTPQQLLTGEKPEDYGLVNQWGLSRKNIFGSVKASLKRLDVEYIDVLQCHRFDTNVEISEIMRALDDVVKSGMVRYIGMSSCWAWQFHAMQSKSSQLLTRLGIGFYDLSPIQITHSPMD
jgi:aryl-alcohol dehydrogenase-like predicted oxidoreductase